MTVEDKHVVDIISIDKDGNVILTISDHLEWTDTGSHLLTLQDKINCYLAFVESGEILTSYPKAKDRPVVMEVVFKYSPEADGRKFLDIARSIIHDAGFQFRWKVFSPTGKAES